MSTLYVATRKGLFSYQQSTAGAWELARTDFLGVEVSVAATSPDGQTVFAALNHGHFGAKLHRSTDGGTTWTECAAPAYPPLPEGQAPDTCPMRGIEIPWTLKMIWALAVSPSAPATVWCGSIPGGLFKSTNNGDTWSLVESLWHRPERRRWMGGGYDFPGIHSVAVHPTDADDVIVGVSCGGVWRTRDGGATWALYCKGMVADYMPPDQAEDAGIQDIHRLVRCAADPDVLWVQHHSGIFRSTDAGENWVAIAEAGPSTFGFPVAVHPAQPGTAWFVPAVKDEMRIPKDGMVVVTRTRDGGASFETLRQGLPQGPAWDLCFRHGLAVDATGSRLAMGSTTGNLWTTADGGDSWTEVSHNLPPIYSLTFS